MVSLKLKLVIDKRANRVLFAEAGKDFVDFIFHILSLPLGSLTSILSGSADDTVMDMPGCLGSLYEGVKDLDGRFINLTKRQLLLNSKATLYAAVCHKLLPEVSLPGIRTFRRRSKKSWGVCFSYNEPGRVDTCYLEQESPSGDSTELAMVRGGTGGAGYVKSQSLFMVLDNLVAHPMSAVSALSLMGRDQLGCFENKEVEFGRGEALKLLKAFLQSKTVLTDVFLKGGAAGQRLVEKIEPCCD